jgi:heterotetrameric sarcosine oxidase delta subunit
VDQEMKQNFITEAKHTLVIQKNQKNPKGWFAERWVHNVGCRRWFNIWRNTVNHEFGPSYKPFTKQPSRPK